MFDFTVAALIVMDQFSVSVYIDVDADVVVAVVVVVVVGGVFGTLEFSYLGFLLSRYCPVSKKCKLIIIKNGKGLQNAAVAIFSICHSMF